MRVVADEKSFSPCARTQVKCSEYFPFGYNTARKSFKILPRNTAVAISARQVTQVPVAALLQERDVERTKVEIRREEWSVSLPSPRSVQSPKFLIYINYTGEESFYLG